MQSSDTKKQILVVEDEGLIAADIRHQLERLGYAVPAIASSGEDALHLARSTPFDLVLMDIHLKGELDGIATARVLRDELQTPVVYITAHADQETVSRAAVTEPFGYILKPVTDGDLRSAVQIALYKHEMDRRLRTSEAWLATTLRCVGDGIIATDTNGEIVFMNPVAERLCGYPTEAAQGRPLMDILGLRDETSDEPARNPVYELDDDMRAAYSLLSASGVATPVEVECFENRSREELLGAIVTLRDIAARRELEARIMQSQRMEAIAGMAGGLAHDFNNQLTVILGNAADLCERLSGECCDSARSIHQAASSAATLTAQLLTLSRRDVVRPKVIDVNEVVREIQPAIEHMLGSRTTVTLEFTQPVGFIRGDSNHLKQVLLNIALYARDSMPFGGKFSIETRTAEVRPESPAAHLCRPGLYVYIRIEDNGKGMDKAALTRIFEPFSADAVQHTAGLGLAIAHSIVVQNGGTITATSEPGKGSCFDILLPCVGTFVEPEEPNFFTILVAEDESGVRQLIHRVLEREGYQILEATNAEEAEALATAFSQPIDLLITDVIMPGITGNELAARLAGPHPGMRVLFISGYRHDTLEDQGLLDRRINLLAKPFPVAELLKRVRAALEQEPASTR